ncbi:MAG: hypothetical protein IJD82_10430 [Clostridia bacterium]|nr:hypothetical protein [Clostridia bacterium]
MWTGNARPYNGAPHAFRYTYKNDASAAFLMSAVDACFLMKSCADLPTK